MNINSHVSFFSLSRPIAIIFLPFSCNCRNYDWMAGKKKIKTGRNKETKTHCKTTHCMNAFTHIPLWTQTRSSGIVRASKHELLKLKKWNWKVEILLETGKTITFFKFPKQNLCLILSAVKKDLLWNRTLIHVLVCCR